MKLSRSGQGTVESSYKHGNVSLDSIKSRQFLDEDAAVASQKGHCCIQFIRLPKCV
jgi:hypothetical protein